MNKKVRNNIKLSKLMIIFAFFCFGIIIARTVYLAISNKIDGIDIKDFASSRSTAKKTIYAGRGTIYDVNKEVLAENVSSYTLIAYLDEARSLNSSIPKHVVDKEYTAEKLATVLDMSKEQILNYLNQDGKYQVEFGPKAKGLTELTKDKIKELNLPGIDFIESVQRYYPNGDFLSYVLGYAKKNDDGLIVGELGIEQLYNEKLSGIDGYTIYQKDRNGYKIPDTKEVTKASEMGDDIYLTIDSNVQVFVENALKDNYSKYKPEWMTMIVADAKTGKILASSSKPSFNPNILDITNYNDLNISLPYEPGSTMKIYTYMAAMEKGTYNGSLKFKSGSYKVDNETTISDWNKKGFGTITFDQGFVASSNVGIINVLNKFINANDLKEYLIKMGFGSKTNVSLANEAKGKISFKYKTEIYNAGFGQGITTTPMQHIKALTAIANDGILLQPYIIEKIVNGSTGEVILENERTELDTVASKETVDKIKNLMYMVINGGSGSYNTGSPYKIKGYEIIGKTGTSQLFNTKSGKYYTDDYNVIRSVSLMYPKDNPQIIIYAAAKRSSAKALSNAVKSVIQNTATYYNIFNKEHEKTKVKNFKIESYINKYTSDVLAKLNSNSINYVLIGDGNKIINQYPDKNSIINNNEKVFLITNGNNYRMPNLKGYSLSDIKVLTNLLNIKYQTEGYGYVYEQNIKKDTLINNDSILILKLKELYST